MRLRNIKLSGFKSFVDPTTLIVPDNLVGIVGPNGCGKSNIIDAVTWVLGESSAKHLRGESLTDVIFNGSSTRQPVGQASVELTFENVEGRLGGQYASYTEISIKRTMNREGISNYYLNGSRCRRKDITAIFLGTGIGPRSYALIEQGMISRLIEARPEELRSFIEEAAGISKYRERRRETENRIAHTRENINRLNDIREELGKQLDRLKRQARAAERYQLLKKEERQLKAELLALSWQELDKQIKNQDLITAKQENKAEAGVSRLREIEAAIEKQRQELSAFNEKFNESQSAFYQVGSEISQLEQRIQYSQERIQSLESDIEKARESEKSARLQQQLDEAELARLSESMRGLEPRLHGFRSDSDQAYDTLNQAEQAMQSWQSEWDGFNETMAGFKRQIEVDKTRLENLEVGIAEDLHRRSSLVSELEQVDTQSCQEQAQSLLDQLNAGERDLKEMRAGIESKQQQVKDLRRDVHQISEKLAMQRAEQQKLIGQISSLEALQQNETLDQKEVIEWLTSKGLQDSPRLIQQLMVDPDWTFALETVLGHHLQDICVDEIEDLGSYLDGLGQGRIGLITGSPRPLDSNLKQQRLLDKVSASVPVEGLLDGIYIAENVEDASLIQKELARHESVITRDGVWLGCQWVRINRQEEGYTGSLSREQKIHNLKEQEQSLLQKIKYQQQQLQQLGTELERAEQSLQQEQREFNDRQDELATVQSQYVEYKTRHEQVSLRVQQIQQELDEMDLHSTDDQLELETLRHDLQRTNSDLENLEREGPKLRDIREKHRHALETARERWQSTHEQSHEIALQLESISSQRASLEQAIKRSEIQLSNHAARCEELLAKLETGREPLASLQENLGEKLAEKVEAEKALSENRSELQTKENELRLQEQRRTDAEEIVQTLRDELATAKMNAQETRVRLQTVAEQLQEHGHDVEEILQQLDEAAEKSTWQQRIEDIERKINRLGPINLAAIDEYNQLLERKEYLDKQNEDLSDALQTLESAIRKIDRETRTRFKETFDFLNTNLKEMFPVLFGGGHAYLELTGDDLLETGVSIMARPPGKRNSTIQLLSGGEKAMVAVALVFAIFKLNPAPFCILDEVDAPLDDNNTLRFCDLVKQMSSEVQFIFITHNKITMETANQLLGVTMYEPGVSRLVSVDIDEAVELAASA